MVMPGWSGRQRHASVRRRGCRGPHARIPSDADALNALVDQVTALGLWHELQPPASPWSPESTATTCRRVTDSAKLFCSAAVALNTIIKKSAVLKDADLEFPEQRVCSVTGHATQSGSNPVEGSRLCIGKLEAPRINTHRAYSVARRQGPKLLSHVRAIKDGMVERGALQVLPRHLVDELDSLGQHA